MQQNSFPVPPWPGWSTTAQLGRGGFGAVYRIERDNFGSVEQAAMKVITIPQNDGDIQELYSDGYPFDTISAHYTEHMKSIVHEYSMMAQLKGCANVVYCDDVYQQRHADGVGWDIFIRMELLTPLPKTLGADYDEAAVIRIGMDLANALRVCHDHKIIHRDIKPQNIFVSADGTYKLGDFGIAKVTERTMSGTRIGTYKYMAPEVYHDAPYGAAADVYSLGMVLYWLMNDRCAPFAPLQPAIPTYVQEEQAKARRFSGELLPAPINGSEALKALVLRCCAYDPAERPSAEALFGALKDLELQHRLAQSASAERRQGSAPADTGVPIDRLEEDDEFSLPEDWTVPVSVPPRPISPDEDREPTIPPAPDRDPIVSPPPQDDVTVGLDESQPVLGQSAHAPGQEEDFVPGRGNTSERERAPKDEPDAAPQPKAKSGKAKRGQELMIGAAVVALLVVTLIAISVARDSSRTNSDPVPLQEAIDYKRYYREDKSFHLDNSPGFSGMIAAMQQFEQKTGVTPCLYLVRAVYGSEEPSDDEVHRFAVANYPALFEDENGMLLIAYKFQDGGFFYYYIFGNDNLYAELGTRMNDAMQSRAVDGSSADDIVSYFTDVFTVMSSS